MATMRPDAPADDPDGAAHKPMRSLAELALEERQTTSWRELPGVIVRAFGLVCRAGRNALPPTSLLPLTSADDVVVQRFLAKTVIDDTLAAVGGSSGRFTSILPEILELAVLTVVLDVFASWRAEQGRILGELVARSAFDRILDVATRVDLLVYE